MKFIDSAKEKAARSKKHIVLPEGMDKRVSDAACEVAKEGFAEITLIESLEKSELTEKYNQEMLLHIDLYWGNIVSSGEGSYRIVDPKGVIGDPIFEMGQNLLEECFKYEGQPKNIEFIFNYFEKSLSIPNRVLREVFYIENVRFVCECNDGLDEGDIERLEFAEKVMGG